MKYFHYYVSINILLVLLISSLFFCSLFQQIYERFCTKHGLDPESVKDKKNVLDKFRLKIKNRSDKTTDAFKNIRWMSLKEQQAHKSQKELKDAASNLAKSKNPAETHDIGKPNSGKEGSLTEFLDSQCVASLFDDDYILVSHFKQRYDQWCMSHGYTGIRKEAVDGEFLPIVQFGARFEAASRKFLLFIK